MRRVLLGCSVCIAVGVLLFAVPTAGAGTAAPVEHCPGRVAVSRYGVTLAAGRIHVDAFGYRQRRLRPAITCNGADLVIRAYLTAKLYRPLNQCTVPSEKGQWCHVDHWLCAAAYPASRDPSPEQECAHVRIDGAGRVRRLTHIWFRETDNDRG